MIDQDRSEALQQAVREACENGRSLRIVGGGSKDFYGNACAADNLSTLGHSGILSYEPTELVLRARSGTPLIEIERLLEENGQRLAFEPPHFGPDATIGGAVASGLAGPGRVYGGAVKDSVLGVGLINGNAERLNFGGQVMKNVAGYDISRLMAGSLGTLALITDISLKVLPRPPQDLTLSVDCDLPSALQSLLLWNRKPLPISASFYHDGRLLIRLSGSEAAIASARNQIGGNTVEKAGSFWRSVREQELPFFRSGAPLWRLSVAPATAPLESTFPQAMEWNGAQRWIATDISSEEMFAKATDLGGHATLFRGGYRAAGVFQKLPTALMDLHRRLKASMDPQGIFSPGRLYPEL